MVLTLENFIISQVGQVFNPLGTDRRLQFLLSSCAAHKRREQQEFYAKLNDQRFTSVIYKNGVKRVTFFVQRRVFEP